MQIIKITPIKKKQFFITTDINYSFTLSQETVVKFHIKEGIEFDDKQMHDIIFEEEKAQAMNSVWHILELRQRSKFEIIEYLKRKSFSTETIDYIINRVEELGYINDKKFAANLFNYRKEQGKGILYIKNELQNKGIDKNIFSEIIKENAESPEQEFEKIKQLAEKKLNSLTGKGLKSDLMVSRLIGYLGRRGYEIEVIMKVIRVLRDTIQSEKNERKN